jgi:hypothetical protein
VYRKTGGNTKGLRPAAGKTLSLMAAVKRDAKQVNNANCYQ